MGPLCNIHTFFRALFFLLKETSIFYLEPAQSSILWHTCVYNIDERGLACSAEKCDRFIYAFLTFSGGPNLSFLFLTESHGVQYTVEYRIYSSMVRCCMVRYDMPWHCRAWHLAWHRLHSYSVIWHGHGLVWYGIVKLLYSNWVR
jgi:hypothetical protein